MSEQLTLAIVTGVIIGAICAVPLTLMYFTLRQLLKIVARSKLSLYDYLALELGDLP